MLPILKRSCDVALVAGLLAVLVPGCSQPPSNKTETEIPGVPVSKPVAREVTDYVDFTGRTDAVEAVDIRARVTGYLTKMPFREGSEVKKDEQLFEIDPRPYQAQLDQAQSQVALNEASLNLARTTYARDRSISSSTAGGVSAQQLDQDRAMVDEAIARLKASQASTEVYKLNLSFTKVVSPIDGQVSRYYYTRGNLVNQDQTLLTTIVSLDPMHVYFDVDEPTLIRIKEAINAGKFSLQQQDDKRPALGGLVGQKVNMGLQTEENLFPHEGKINFVNNQVNPTTGSISVRGVFPNPKPERGTRLLLPGMFVRVRLPMGEPHPALLVIDRAIASDQGQKTVYVVRRVKDKNDPTKEVDKLVTVRIKTGPLQPDGLRVVTEGLKADDWVVVGALQQIRPNMTVKMDPTPMPTYGVVQDAAPAESKEAPKPADKPK